MTAVWPRATYQVGGGAAHVALIALSGQRLPDPLPISRTKHGMPDDGLGPESVALVARDRSDDPEGFVERVVAPFMELITTDLGEPAAAFALTAAHAYVIEAELDDPDDLGHVQAAWALAKCVCEEGAAIVIDVYAARAHLGHDIAQLDPERGFDLMHEVTLFFDEQGDGTLAAWSLGLVKFGRPDLVILGVDPDSAAATAVVLRDAAALLAAGAILEPGASVATAAGQNLAVSRFEHETAPVVAVDGPALLLAPS